jgi:hypothetical protein
MEQAALDLRATSAISSDPAMSRQHPVTGNHNRNRISAQRIADRSTGPGRAYGLGHFAIGAHFSGGNFSGAL